MQSTPLRLSQALWSAFKAAKPVAGRSSFQCTPFIETRVPRFQSLRQDRQSPLLRSIRAYSSTNKDGSEIERQAQEAKKRIEESLESRAEIAQDAEPALKPERDETIVHTLPESSSIVHTTDAESNTPRTKEPASGHGDPSKSDNTRSSNPTYEKYKSWATSKWEDSPLPSQIESLRSRATVRFSSFMDNLQSHIVVASHHLNDLTGYSGIERLKKDIEAQEVEVKNARQKVKDTRDRYSEAIAKRSDTQREVNDLLHRKHAWSPTDLERFTHLYRSDHANEQAEQRSQQDLSDSEAQYEEASTRLAKSILARYHEEQIWSDKIRQMSTWGTWGLMGLNVLLFIVFQIAIEPWRRKRLVKGFEEKVQKALDEKEKVADEKMIAFQSQAQAQAQAQAHLQRDGDQVVQDAVHKGSVGTVATAAEQVAEAIADAVTGSTSTDEMAASDQQGQSNLNMKSQEEIEDAVEQVTTRELDEEDGQIQTSQSQTVSTTDAPNPDTAPPVTPPPSWPSDIEIDTNLGASSTSTPQSSSPSYPTKHQPQPETLQSAIRTTLINLQTQITQAYHHYAAILVRQFTDREHVVLSRRELSTSVLEGFVVGFVFAVGCGMFIGGGAPGRMGR